MARNISQLEAYYWSARLGSFQAAAEHLGLTQPTISIRIKELETDAGTRLFIRNSRGVRLTEHGRALFDHVQGVISLLYDLDVHFQSANPLRGILRFGVPDSFAICCLAPFMRIIKSRHPELNIAVTVDNSYSLARRLEKNRLDLAILSQPEKSSAFHAVSLGHQFLAVIASPELSLPSHRLTPKDLHQQSIVTNPSPSPSFAVLMDWFASDGLAPLHVSTCNSIAAIVPILLDAQALSAFPSCVVQHHLSRGELLALDITPPLPKLEMYAAYSRGNASRGMKQIIDVIRDAVKGTGFVGQV